MRALHSTGPIVGSSQEALPSIPAHSQSDYYGFLGEVGLGAPLTGTPARVEINVAAHGQAGPGWLPMLKTSEVMLAAGHEDTFTDAAHSYNLTAKVTTTTGQELTGGDTQQVVLYDQAGHVVGGGTGSSDNVPHNLPAGMSL